MGDIKLKDLKKDEVVAVLDMDMYKYKAASAGETRSIIVSHVPSGRQKTFKNKTEFKGRGKKIGGWLGEVNQQREEEGKTPFSLEEFEIEDVQTPEPLENVLHTVKMMVDSTLKALNTTRYKAFIGEGDGFRLEKSTLMKYKGSREDTNKPVLLDEVVKYIKKKYKPTLVTDVEADDKIVMEAYKKPDHVVVAEDKDAMGCPIKVFNPFKPELGVVDCDCFGELWIAPNGKDVKGKGRLWLYFQTAYGDPTDNYRNTSATSKQCGEKTVYNKMKDCKNDKEALQVVVDIYKNLYPEPTVAKGWRGDDIEVDWMYVMKENWTMARMLRFEGDDVDIVDVLDKLEVDY